VLVLLFLFAVIIIYLFIYFEKKERETKFLLTAVLFTYGSGAVQNKFFGGIRYRPFFS